MSTIITRISYGRTCRHDLDMKGLLRLLKRLY